MSRESTFVTLLSENVQDWFYSNCNRKCYESDSDYIEDIRYMIVNTNDYMVERCMDDLVDVYDMDSDELDDYYTSVVEILIRESQNALDNFHYENVEE